MTTGRWLVALQGLLFLLVAVTAFLPGPTLFSSLVVGLACVVVGAAVVLWTGRALGASLTPNPSPNGAGMVASGPYRFARHPMYSGLVVICLGVAVGAGVVWCYLAVLVLAVISIEWLYQFAAHINSHVNASVPTVAQSIPHSY